jgi:transposase-like protein
MRWADGNVTRPRCGHGDPSFIASRRIWRCRACRKQFSLKVGTIFEDSPLGFDKWLPAIWLIANSKNSVSSHEMGRALGVGQKTAWFMLHRIREAMQSGTFQRMSGITEVDDTFIGGLAKNMHRKVRAQKIHASGTFPWSVPGLIDRGPYPISGRLLAHGKLSTSSVLCDGAGGHHVAVLLHDQAGEASCLPHKPGLRGRQKDCVLGPGGHQHRARPSASLQGLLTRQGHLTATHRRPCRTALRLTAIR